MSYPGFPDEVLFKEGKIRVILTQENDYEIFVNGGLARTIHRPGRPDTPDEKEIYSALRDVGIDPDLL